MTIRLVLIVLFFNVILSSRTFAQAQELEQLSLDITKLLQFRQILSDMKEGYEILTKGYGTVRELSQGNFDLHQTFLNGLLQVSPTVQKYERIAQIIQLQVQLLQEYTSAQKRFAASGLLQADELDYIGRVYQQLLTRSLHNVADLGTVLTAGQLRMSDDQRLAAIDRIYTDQQDQHTFLKSFNNKNDVLLVQRAKDKSDVNSYRYWYDK